MAGDLGSVQGIQRAVNAECGLLEGRDDAGRLLHVGVKYNRIITVDLSEIAVPPSRLRYGERTLIFGKSKCPVCGGPITRFEIAKRRAFRCDGCQAKEVVSPA